MALTIIYKDLARFGNPHVADGKALRIIDSSLGVTLDSK
jgi:hypothetical protein